MKQALQPLPSVWSALPPSTNRAPRRSPADTETDPVAEQLLLLPEIVQERLVLASFFRTVTVQESPEPGESFT